MAMNRSNFYQASLATLLALLTGCSGRGDSLAREKASMESEAKAMAAHDSKPKASGERPSPLTTDPLIRKPSAAGGVKLPAGTIFRGAATQSLSTRSAIIGQDWTCQLADDVKDGKGNETAWRPHE